MGTGPTGSPTRPGRPTARTTGASCPGRTQLTHSGRFSNGLTWPEQLAQHLGVSSVQDGAYGGATVNNSRVQGYTGYESDGT